MSLSTTLAADIKSIIAAEVDVSTRAKAAAAWRDALVDWASDAAVLNPGPIPAIPVGDGALLESLETAFGAGNAAGAASGMSLAIDTWWMTTLVTGAVVGSTGGAALTATLTAILSDLSGTHETKSAQIAAAIETHAALVVAVFPGPTPPSGTFGVQ